MQGKKNYEPKIFYTVRLDDMVPAGHELRRVLSVVDFSFVRNLVKDRYSHTGQPSVDPEVIIKLLFLGYYYGILSERQLMKRTETDLAFRWFLGYDLDEKVPTHSVLSKVRDRYGVQIFQNIFDKIVEQCIEANLVEGKQAFMDATTIDANASKRSIRPRLKVLTPSDYTEKMLDGAEEKESNSKPPKKLPYNERMVSHTDPEATMHRKKGAKMSALSYEGHYAIDDKCRVVVAATASNTIEQADKQVPKLLLGAKFRHGFNFQSFCADSEYGTQDLLHFLFSEEIMPYIPSLHRKKEPNPFAKEEFHYDTEQDTYTCPEGHILTRRSYHSKKKRYDYRHVIPKNCKACLWKRQCVPRRDARVIQRLLYQTAVDRARSLRKTLEYSNHIKRRKHLMESIFGEAKNFHGLGRARFRGLAKVKIQVLWIATVLNIKRLIQYSGRYGLSMGKCVPVSNFSLLTKTIKRILTSLLNCQRTFAEVPI